MISLQNCAIRTGGRDVNEIVDDSGQKSQLKTDYFATFIKESFGNFTFWGQRTCQNLTSVNSD